MSVLTHHWSGTGAVQNDDTRRDYHIAYGAPNGISQDLRHRLLGITRAQDVDFAELRGHFTIEKNHDLSTATNFATFEMNHDPRDGSPNIEISALSMGGHAVSTTGPWGPNPFTIAHAFMAAAIGARICIIKGIDTGGSFPAPAGFQHGPLHVISTHAERAYQTIDHPKPEHPERGYFIFSGDPDSRWDLAALDVSRAKALATYEGAIKSAVDSAAWIRQMTHEIRLSKPTDLWGLDR